MKIDDKIEAKISELIALGSALSIGNQIGQRRDEAHSSQCVAWLTQVANIIVIICPVADHPYRKRIEEILTEDRGLMIPSQVGDLTEIMKVMMEDVRSGIVGGLSNQIRAETLDDLLDQAKTFLEDKEQGLAAVIAAVVFEDGIRKLSRSKGISDANVKTDTLFTQLEKNGVISSLQTKKLRYGAGVRNKALHSQFQELAESDIEALVDITRGILAQLASV